MATVSKFANANTVVSTGWTSPTNAYADDAAYTTAAPAKSTSITTDYGFPAFTSSELPECLINSVTFEIQYKSDTTGSTGAVIGLQGNDNGSLLGSETTFGMNLTDQTVTKQYTTGISRADLLNANFVRARVRGFRSSSNTAITWSVDYVKVTVDYTWQPTLSGISSAAAIGSPSIATTVSPSAIATSETIGSSTIVPVAGVSGIASAESTGTASVLPSATLTAIASAEAVGLGSVVFTVSVSAIAGAEAFGIAAISDAALTLQLDGIASAATFGVCSLASNIVTAAIASAEASGQSDVSEVLSPAGIASSENVGTLQVTVTISASAVGPTESLGSIVLEPYLSLIQINSSSSFGNIGLALNCPISAIPSEETIGLSWVGNPPAGCSPGVASTCGWWWSQNS